MSRESCLASDELVRGLRPLHFFTLAFGSIVGSAWIVLLGDWFAIAAPGAAVTGFLAGALVICGVVTCYAEMTARLPFAGGEIIYALRVIGPFAAFIVGWFTSLFLIGIMAFEGIALGVLAIDLAPMLAGPTLYEVFGQPVALGTLVLGLGGGVMLCIINVRGVITAANFQVVGTISFLAIVAIVVAAAVVGGDPANLAPPFYRVGGHSWLSGAAWIFATCPLWLNNFQGAIQAVEERRPDVSLRAVGRALVAAVLAAAAFYICLILSVGMIAPWQSLAGRPVAVTIAMDHLDPSGWLRQLVLIGALVSLAKAWNGIVLTAARVLMAQARLGFVPRVFARIHPRYGSPHAAIIFVTAASLIGMLFGRAAILPIVGTLSISATLILTMTSAGLIILRRRDKSVPAYVAPFGYLMPLLSSAGAMAMGVYALLSPWLSSTHHFPLEWALLLAWLFMGIMVWLLRSRVVDDVSVVDSGEIDAGKGIVAEQTRL